ncbi:MAG TPA: tetratricopeptide repeat protein [Blastocatellia bacterium]|nr:tetratricopeptide repeat protein [Blastocatellia bacterium]
MRASKAKLIHVTAMGLGLMFFSACGAAWESAATNSATIPAAAPIPPDEEAVKVSTRILEERVKRDPEDFVAHNKLAGYYLTFLRETGNTRFLELASRAARASLDVLPAEQNLGGLTALSQVELASHDFISARDHAELLVRLEPRKSYPYRILGDALIELGDYDKAAAAYKKMEQLGFGISSETALARLALIKGDVASCTQHLIRALTLATEQVPQPRETVAWCRWQLGETAFSVGDYKAAERHARDALITFPDYYRALASLGRALAAQGDLAGAIEQYERAVRILPDPAFVAALGDLYRLAGRDREADAQHALVEQIARVGQLNGALYNRQIALFYADHDIKAEEAYAQAKKEYETRRDIYGADALAWTALKSGRTAEARSAINEAMRLGTRDARLYYHAGMIARAAGDNGAAREYLSRALSLSPEFDPLQSRIAKRALEE